MAISTSKAETKSARFAHLDAMMAAARGKTPRTVAVVQAVSAYALGAALQAAREGFVRLVLIGDAKRTREVAAAEGFDLESTPLVDAPKDTDAAKEAVALVRRSDAELLMKGHIHTDDFLRPVLDRENGLRTGKMMSHAFVCYLPQDVYAKALLLTDGAFNIAPDLAAKRAIVENGISLARAIGIAHPKVAVLAATEEVNPAMPATTDARALREMSRAGEITGAYVDGPFAFDNAISREAARTKGIDSPVCGEPDMLLVPDIEAGNMLYKEMVYFCGAITPGLVLGAAVPMILTSRADPPMARLASCALAVHFASS